MKKILKTLPYFIVAILVGVTVVYAGNLTPPGSPSKTMKSLADLYELIDTGVNTPSTNFDTPSTVSSTMNSLNDIYDLMVNKISSIDPTTIVTGTTIFGIEGEATVGVPATIFASADQTTYSCEALATDPTQPALTLETICGYNSKEGCSWSEGACIGGIKNPTYMNWYTATASCSEKSDEGSTSWRLPTAPELVTHYFNNNNDGNQPTGFADGFYWSDTTHQTPVNESYSYYVNMGNRGGGTTNNNLKTTATSYLTHCVR